MKRFLINEKYIVEGTLKTAENWLLENHPEEYFGASICQVDKNNESISGGDFLLIAVLEYYQEELGIEDPKEIIKYIKENNQ